MHCLSCDCALSDYEAKRKDLNGKFIDLCASCYYDVRLDVLSIDDADVSYRDENTEPYNE